MSESSLKEGVALFKGLSDKANTALLYTNKGRLMRLLAQVHTQNTLLQDSPQFTEIERKYYKQVQLLPSAFFLNYVDQFKRNNSMFSLFKITFTV